MKMLRLEIAALVLCTAVSLIGSNIVRCVGEVWCQIQNRIRTLQTWKDNERDLGSDETSANPFEVNPFLEMTLESMA